MKVFPQIEWILISLKILFQKILENLPREMARTLASERAAQAGANPAAAPAAAALPVAEPVAVLTAAALPAVKPTGRNREPIARYKPETIIKNKARKTRGKTAKKIYIRGFYAVCIAENTKPKLPRRERMQFAYRYVVNGKEEDDYSWVNLHDIFGHPEEEQFVGCLYELLAKHVGNAVNDLGTPAMQGADLLNKRYKK